MYNKISNIAVCIYRYMNTHTVLFLERLQTHDYINIHSIANDCSSK